MLFNKEDKKSALSGFTHSTLSCSASVLMICAEQVKFILQSMAVSEVMFSSQGCEQGACSES